MTSVKAIWTKALFYVRKTIENNWSRAVLLNFLDTDLYEREGKAVSNFKETLPLPLGDLAQQIVKDPYNFNFLSLTEKYTEKELKDALMDNIQRFLLDELQLSDSLSANTRIMLRRNMRWNQAVSQWAYQPTSCPDLFQKTLNQHCRL